MPADNVGIAVVADHESTQATEPAPLAEVRGEAHTTVSGEGGGQGCPAVLSCMMDSFEVRVGGDDHLCCGDEIELNSLVRLRARRRGDPAVLTEVRHPAERDWDMVFVEGRVTDIHAVVSVGAGVGEERAPITRLPSGRAIRGFDSVDDGLLLSVMNEEPAIGQANGFVVTVLGRCIPDAVPDVNSNASTAGWW